MSSPLRPNEWERFIERHPDASFRVEPEDGPVLMRVPDVALPAGWSAATTPIWFVLPVGYPGAQPDCFWASPTLTLASGGLPSNSNVQAVPIINEPGLWFSWHLAEWRPSLDTISTYMQFILRRFHDAR